MGAATQERPKSAGRGKAAQKAKDEVSAERVKLIQGWDAETLAAFIAETSADDLELAVAVNALDALQRKIGSQATDPFDDTTVGGYPEGEVGRLQKLADDKDAEADDLVEAGDEEGAGILRIEAEDFREKAREKAEELEGEAGQAVGEMPAGDPDPDDDLTPDTIKVAGIPMNYPDVGGKKPTRASLTFVGGKVALVDGTGLKKGQRIKFSGVAIVTFVGQQDETDSATQQVTAAEQVHKAQIRDLQIEVPTAD